MRPAVPIHVVLQVMKATGCRRETVMARALGNECRSIPTQKAIDAELATLGYAPIYAPADREGGSQ